MIIDYLGHSGFLVETEHALLLFDYYRGDLSLAEKKAADKPLFVFVSHVHGDHFNPAVFSLQKSRRGTVRYLLSFDLKGSGSVPADAPVQYLDADRTYEISGLGTVETLRSTDEGVAFYVRTPDAALYHAGDLHWWDWPGEDADWLAEQERVFKEETGRLAGKPMDAAFAVLDGRLEENFARGLAWFLSVCSPSYVLPMHFWGDRTIIDRFLKLPEAEQVMAHGAHLLDTAHETHWELP